MNKQTPRKLVHMCLWNGWRNFELCSLPCGTVQWKNFVKTIIDFWVKYQEQPENAEHRRCFAQFRMIFVCVFFYYFTLLSSVGRPKGWSRYQAHKRREIQWLRNGSTGGFLWHRYDNKCLEVKTSIRDNDTLWSSVINRTFITALFQ